MEHLSFYKGKVMPLFLDLALYQELKINTEIEEKMETEVIYNHENPDHTYVLDHTLFLESEDFQSLKDIFYSEANEFHYCPSCKKTLPIIYKGHTLDEKYKPSILSSDVNISNKEEHMATWSIAKQALAERFLHIRKQLFGDSNVLSIHLECTAAQKHQFLVYFKYTANHGIMKIGQTPSNIEFDNTFSRYKKVIKDKDINFELKRAIGLKSHGVGVGSYVYLRRIFEKLIYKQFEEYMKSHAQYNRKEFNNKRMEDKIPFLKDYLPTSLVENTNLYKVLSKGIHELSEKDCLEYFGPVYESIIIILEEKLEIEEKNNRKNAILKAVNKVHSNLSK
ncbi:hypothetical protein [Paenisporosarcina sp. OV554]|uniref:hypothetical protein n=1 Tax=Paenisporosarcina sp. OV554 TaxID=2135694 RepID=UPI000D3A8459|nr:hypothetical protein [Paenisporosarcina sp. OV554]PUB18244.1 hypothetical protein C8K15_101449 [Paenisporosarcina sp. OV554]